MRKKQWAGMAVACLGGISAARGADETTLGPVILADLKRYYQGEGKAPPWQAAVKLLGENDSAKAGAAATYLVALSTQALADETSGDSPWRATPYWGGGGENPARNLREYLLRAVSELDPPTAAVPVLEWFIRQDPVTVHRVTAMKSLIKCASDEADALIRSFAADQGLSHGLQASAIRRAADRQLEVPDAVLRVAMTDHHADLRSAAADYWTKRRDGALPERFDPVEALRTPRMQAFVDSLAGLIWDPPSPEAPLVQVDRIFRGQGQWKGETKSDRGWRLLHEGKILRMLDFHGRVLEFELGENPESEWGTPSSVSFKELPVAGVVEEFEKLRAAGDPEHQLSEQGGLTGQFQGRAAGLPEMLLACQLRRAGKPDLCARVLFPALDGYAEDQHFFEVAKDRLSTVYGCRMLVEFIGNRDYDKALAIAGRMDREFKDTRFHSQAKTLLKDLPGRRDDFRSLTLPTRAAWEQWRKDRPRDEQIAYLCQRLRLMNCYQYGQPSDVDLFDTQYAEPCGLSDDASYGGGGGKTKVINPLVELLGNSSEEEEEEDDEEKPERIEGMRLGIRDVPAIAPFLRDDHLILAVGFWRTFHPSRTLTGTREILAWVLEKAAKRELVDHREWAKLDEAEVARRIDGMIAWAKERADKSEADLLLEGLDDLANRKEGWHAAWPAAEELVERGDVRAFPLVARWLTMEETGNYQIEHILSTLRKLDPKRAKDLAAGYLDRKELGVRMEAALILLEAGERDRALPVIGDVFAKANYSNMSAEDLRESTGIVAKDNSPRAWEAIARLFDDIGIASSDFNNVPLCRELEARGNPAGLKHYRALLDNRDTGIPNMVGWSRVIAHMFGDKLLEGYAATDPAAKKILAESKPDTEARLTATKAWLNARLKKLDGGGK